MTAVKSVCFQAANRYSPNPLTLHLVRIWGMIPKRDSRLSEGIMRHRENLARHPMTSSWIKV
jgi:hypothetical protein